MKLWKKPKAFKPLIRQLLILLTPSPMILLTPSPLGGVPFDYSGNFHLQGIFQTDDIDSTTVAEVYDTSVSPEEFIGVAVGRDLKKECDLTPNRRCVYRKIGQNGELTLERVTDSGRENKGLVGATSALADIGINAQASRDPYLAKLNGSFVTSVLNDRTLLGDKRFRFQFTEGYFQYQKERFRIAGGRKAPTAGVIVDGITAEYMIGPDGSRDTHILGFFGGLAPNPITKAPSLDYMTLGPTYHWIPQFSSRTEAKLAIDASLVSEFYKHSMNRFYFFSKVSFTPLPTLTLLTYSTFDLPWSGSDNGFKSSLFSFQTFWRPNPAWFFQLGFTQFRIDRYLKEEAVRWVTDSGSQQAVRVGSSLDRSQRYRIDARVSYRPIYEFQPYIRGRYERRTFDSSKTFLNDPRTPPPVPQPQSVDLTLINKKNAYGATTGFRLYFLERISTDSSYSFNRRFQSTSHDFYQSAEWGDNIWTVDGYFQGIFSSRTVDNSVASSTTPGVLTPGVRDNAFDFYIGAGGSYRILSDFILQIRYDFGNEDDYFLDRRTTIHTVLGRIDYHF